MDVCAGGLRCNVLRSREVSSISGSWHSDRGGRNDTVVRGQKAVARGLPQHLLCCMRMLKKTRCLEIGGSVCVPSSTGHHHLSPPVIAGWAVPAWISLQELAGLKEAQSLVNLGHLYKAFHHAAVLGFSHAVFWWWPSPVRLYFSNTSYKYKMQGRNKMTQFILKTWNRIRPDFHLKSLYPQILWIVMAQNC